MTVCTAFITFLAQAAPASGQGQNPPGGILGNPMLMMGILFVMFYFLLIRPQQRQRKEQQARINALQAGDRVITTAGIHALVHHIKERTVTLKVAEGVMLEFDKAAVATVVKKDSGDAK
ncbi:MAG TPA: preprotein translocase subunit YajC [Luteolibacter sp.]